MPEGTIAALAKRYGLSTATVEKFWSDCKTAIHPSGSGGEGTGKPGYGVVTDCVKAKCRNAAKGNASKAVAKHMEK